MRKWWSGAGRGEGLPREAGRDFSESSTSSLLARLARLLSRRVNYAHHSPIGRVSPTELAAPWPVCVGVDPAPPGSGGGFQGRRIKSRRRPGLAGPRRRRILRRPPPAPRMENTKIPAQQQSGEAAWPAWPAPHRYDGPRGGGRSRGLLADEGWTRLLRRGFCWFYELLGGVRVAVAAAAAAAAQPADRRVHSGVGRCPGRALSGCRGKGVGDYDAISGDRSVRGWGWG